MRLDKFGPDVNVIAASGALSVDLPKKFGSYATARVILMAFGLDQADAKVHIDGSLDKLTWINVSLNNAIAAGSPDTITDYTNTTTIKIAGDKTADYKFTNVIYLSLTEDAVTTISRNTVVSAVYNGGADKTTLVLTTAINIPEGEGAAGQVWPAKISTVTLEDHEMDFPYYRYRIDSVSATKGRIEVLGSLKDSSQ